MRPHHHHHHEAHGGRSFCPSSGMRGWRGATAVCLQQNLRETFKQKTRKYNIVNGYLQKLLQRVVSKGVETACWNTISCFSILLRYFRFLHSFLFIFVISPA